MKRRVSIICFCYTYFYPYTLRCKFKQISTLIIKEASQMRSLLLSLLAVFCLTPAVAQAKADSKFKIFGLYGMSMINPADLNNIQKAFTAPKPSDITTSTNFGGGLGLRMGDKWELVAKYEQMGFNSIASSKGFQLIQTMAWVDLNRYFAQGKSFFMYAGLGGGYALGSSIDRMNGTKTEFTGDKTYGAEGQLGFGFMLGKHFSLFFEAGYQYYDAMQIVADVGGSKLKKASSSANATLDLSGAKGSAGLAIHF